MPYNASLQSRETRKEADDSRIKDSTAVLLASMSVVKEATPAAATMAENHSSIS